MVYKGMTLPLLEYGNILFISASEANTAEQSPEMRP